MRSDMLAHVLFDPRGRCNRKGLLLIALGLIGFELGMFLLFWATGLGFTGWLALAAKIAFLWIAVAATSKRLHDLNLSAWWIAGAILSMFACAFVAGLMLAGVAGPAASDMASPTVLIAATIVALPIFGAAIWLHFAHGDLGENRFGPAPGTSGFSSHSQRIEKFEGALQTA